MDFQWNFNGPFLLSFVEFSRESGKPPPDSLEYYSYLYRKGLIFVRSATAIDLIITPDEKGTLETSKEIKLRFV